VAPDGQHLNFRIVRTDSLGIAYGGKDEAPLPAHFKDLPLYLEAQVRHFPAEFSRSSPSF
jgi:hypothetical protein